MNYSVKDTGVGIEEDVLHQVFEKFQRFDPEKNRHVEGTGLGLSICKEIVTILNGKIEAASTYGEGSCFTISIPHTCPSQKEIDTLNALKSDQKIISTQRLKEEIPENTKVLVVDDNEINLQVVELMLREYGLSVDCCLSGEEAIQSVMKKPYDLIFMRSEERRVGKEC